MKPTLGGSVFSYNALTFNYCIGECVESLADACDKVVYLDAKSTDGTLELIEKIASERDNIQIVKGAEWECAPDFRRISLLANRAKSYLDTDWHLLLQADEVIHEDSFKHIREAIRKKKTSFLCRRINLFADRDHYVGFDVPNERKPVSDEVIRLARTELNAHGDSENLHSGADMSKIYLDRIKIWHYGFIRNRKKLVDKSKYLLSWFWGDSTEDERLNQEYDWKNFLDDGHLAELKWEHPARMTEWLSSQE